MPLLHCEPDIFQYQFEVFDQFPDIADQFSLADDIFLKTVFLSQAYENLAQLYLSQTEDS